MEELFSINCLLAFETCLFYQEKNKELFLKLFPVFLLVIPFVFTIYSLFTGNIQIYPLSAISLLNVRYGLNSILAIAIFPVIFFNTGKKAKPLLVFFIVIANYIWLTSAGITQLAIIQEPYRNNFNSREARARTKLINYLLSHLPEKQVMIFGGDLGPIIPASRLEFKFLIFEGVSGWYSDKIPENVNTIILKEGDQLWEKLENIPSFPRDFQLVYEVSPNPRMMVWRRVSPSPIYTSK